MAAAAGGLQGVRLAWGKTQEGSALMTLLRLMPFSTLHEVSDCTGSVRGGTWGLRLQGFNGRGT